MLQLPEFEARLADLQSAAGVPVSRETLLRLDQFLQEFSRWSSKINLVASSTLPAVWDRHVLDSAQLLRLSQTSKRWIDLGSGGGFPGAVIAVLSSAETERRVRLVESNAKKAAFLRTALGLSAPGTTVDNQRIESCDARSERFDTVSARALAPLPRLLELAQPWLMSGAVGLFHKGRDYRSEIEESQREWKFDLLEHASIADADSVILELRDVRRVAL